MINIGDVEAARLSRDLSSVKLALFKAFGIGGSLWRRTRYSGGNGGVTGKSNTVTNVANIVLYVARTQDVTTTQTQSGAEIPNDQYEFAAPGNPDIQTGDVLTSEGNTNLSFSVKTSTYSGYDRSGIVEQRGRVV